MSSKLKNKCPASGKTCFKCGKQGHFTANPYKNFSILFVFYTYFIAIFFAKENRPPILLLFCFYWNPILQAVVYFIPVLLYQTTK